MATCSHAGCTCDNFREELMARADMSPGGICINCGHAVSLHPGKLTGGTNMSFFPWLWNLLFRNESDIPHNLCLDNPTGTTNPASNISKDHVYVIGDDVWGATSTAFAIGPKAVLSCSHCLKKIDVNADFPTYIEDYWLVKRMNHSKGTVSEVGPRIRIKLFKFNLKNDWALFIREDGEEFSQYAEIDYRLGNHLNECQCCIEEQDITLLHCPVSLFHRLCGIGREYKLQCSRQHLNVYFQSSHHLYYLGSNFVRGSSGGALHIRGCSKVLGWHCDAVSGEEFENPYLKPEVECQENDKCEDDVEAIDLSGKLVSGKRVFDKQVSGKKTKRAFNSKDAQDLLEAKKQRTEAKVQLECLSDTVASLSGGVSTQGASSIISKFPRLVNYINELNKKN